MKRIAIMLILSAITMTQVSLQPATAVIASPTVSCVGLVCKYDFTFPPYQEFYAWTAPQSGTYTFEVWGAQGGAAGSTQGAKGGYAKGEISLTVNDSFYVFVGGAGTDSGGGLSDRRDGGYNGGGHGYNGNSSSYRAAGGGGATDIRSIFNNLYTRQIVAGGGGGGSWISGETNYPGVGGGLNGDTGTATNSGGVSANGGGGSQTAGGAGGAYFTSTNPGTFGLGGNGTSATYGTPGGGAGWYGGGAGGSTQASGGGSSYLGYLTNAETFSGKQSMPQESGSNAVGRSGNGFARITYTKLPVAMSLSLQLPGGTIQAYKGVVIALSATVNQAGRITFYADGRKIPGCMSLLAAIGANTCNWKPTLRKSVRLSARITPSSVLYLPASGEISIGVVQRTTKR